MSGDTKNKLILRKRHFFVIEKYVEDVKQDEKCVFSQMGFQAVCQRPISDYPLQPISRPCSIEKYSSSRMANRYTRIFDAG